MSEPASAFNAWVNFYLMTGSSAAALTGLMFVVITLVSGSERVAKNPAGIDSYSTPTVLHFCGALFGSAVLLAPWRSLLPASVLLGLAGLYGVIYTVRTANLAKRLVEYVPDVEDWAWYTILPLVSYAALLAGAVALTSVPLKALFAVAGSLLLLIFIGIRNAWDVVTFIATGGPSQTPGS